MRLQKSLKFSLIFFVIITFLVIIFRPTDTGLNQIMTSNFIKAVSLVIKELVTTLSISLLPSIIIFLVFYFYILKPSSE
ncbi:preprotein translocase subunit YajC [Staphylococcus equorum]|uniref:Preprotein translocase subunit YajC n=1 Tax=Staphylococcus equorum TaxID=246432 RepID=A0A9X4L5S7_9STAP|nr:preprotein translocase subunit YajC [Staphylococcus equorum]MDG0820633.1 preprotein translocase subunit YajC [Staphylococcus equorum]MDG0825974.1 preprotein translocase subunit YajC [Staphylococcus equorum]MDG0841258.1 preprotein translocase subunit YajC [Staphylococcus equorum]MDG0846920.1 preprotein translocase subunit YajC [Staphylococcus equorum]MEB7722122.1 preprotein translocase subunit YajC [Staphylococcus equorum]